MTPNVVRFYGLFSLALAYVNKNIWKVLGKQGINDFFTLKSLLLQMGPIFGTEIGCHVN